MNPPKNPKERHETLRTFKNFLMVVCSICHLCHLLRNFVVRGLWGLCSIYRLFSFTQLFHMSLFIIVQFVLCRFVIMIVICKYNNPTPQPPTSTYNTRTNNDVNKNDEYTINDTQRHIRTHYKTNSDTTHKRHKLKRNPLIKVPQESYLVGGCRLCVFANIQ